MTNIILSEKPWHIDLFENIKNRCLGDWVLIRDKKDFIFSNISKINPKYIFVPHWSYLINKDIYENFECIIFHMTDLPYGRGGTPLQNLIVRGHKTTKLTAFQCEKGCDTGPIYIKKDLTLDGRAQDIYNRASYLMEDMIYDIVFNNIKPTEQSGNVVNFSRLCPEDSVISNKSTLKELYDQIRMLDAGGYPLAHIEVQNFKFEFSDAKLRTNELYAKIKITQKKEEI